MANLSKASNVVQERYILYDVTGFTQNWHSIPVATNCKGREEEARRKTKDTNCGREGQGWDLSAGPPSRVPRA